MNGVDAAKWAEQLVSNLRDKRGGTLTKADVRRMRELYDALALELHMIEQQMESSR